MRQSCTALLVGAAVSSAAAPATLAEMRSNLTFTLQDIPPEPRTGDDDWVQLNNGEWLRGEITELQDDSFTFESDEFDTQKLEFEDIHAIYSSRTNTIMLTDRTTVQGRLRIEGDTVIITTDDGDMALKRSDIRSVIPGHMRERNYWSGKISLGATYQRGNTDQTDINTSFRLERRDALSRLTFNYDGTYSTVNGEETTDTQHALINWDVYVTERFYLRPIRVEAFHDRFQNIEYRITPSVGAGYDLIDDGDLRWTVGAGFGWQFIRYDEAPPGESLTDDTAAVLFGTEVVWEATSNIDIRFAYSVTSPVPDSNTYNSRADFRAEFDLWRDLESDVGVVWNHDNDPQAETDGSLPDKDDVRLFVGLGWEF
jgi:putative salt-induced outer membrane protein YdiY